VFEIGTGGPGVTLLLRDGFVTEEFSSIWPGPTTARAYISAASMG
jgi:hypothetical protein